MTAPEWKEDQRMNIYGSKGPLVIVLHGGPGAPGSAAPLARGLAKNFRVIEPFQRPGEDRPLSVAVHIDDLHRLISVHCRDQVPALVGESWGAMLALAYAADHPSPLGPIVLVGCGSFDEKSRKQTAATRKLRIETHIRQHPEHRFDLALPFEAQIMKWHGMTDNFDCDSGPDMSRFDAKAHIETWNDMLRCQKEGIYPQAFPLITSPVLMLHGAYDPHPGKMIRDSLIPFIPRLEYHEFENCGHCPPRERQAKAAFFKLLSAWLNMQMSPL